jgi:hypothetical protein
MPGSASTTSGRSPVPLSLPSVCRGLPGRRKHPHTTHLHNFPEQVTIIRPAHPFEGKSLAVLGHTHRNDQLHLLLILPDGSKSLIPAEWTDLSPAPNLSVHNHSATLASLDQLIRMRTVVDALLRRLAPATSGAAEPIADEESNRATTTQLSGQPSAGHIRLGTPRSGTEKHLDPSPCTSDRQGSLNQGAEQ